MISSMTTIEFLYYNSESFFWVFLLLHLSFRPLMRAGYFVINFWFWVLGFHTFFRFSLFFGIEFVEYIVRIYLISHFLPVIFMTCPLSRLHPIIRYVLWISIGSSFRIWCTVDLWFAVQIVIIHYVFRTWHPCSMLIRHKGVERTIRYVVCTCEWYKKRARQR